MASRLVRGQKVLVKQAGKGQPETMIFLEKVGPFHAKVVNTKMKLEIVRIFEIDIGGDTNGNGNVKATAGQDSSGN